MIKKILGFVLLFAGLIVIIYGLYSSFNIFTAKTLAPEIFTFEAKETQDVQAQILKEILPTESLPILLNLMTWSIFAGILIFGGAQISSLGIKLLRI